MVAGDAIAERGDAMTVPLRAIAQDSPWESPEELDAFLADVYAARRRD
jgi:hypothetical protein